MFPRPADLFSTKYCTLSVEGDVTTQRRLIACPSRDGERWCVRSQTRSYDDEGGGEQAHPFSYFMLIKDAFNDYKDYTLTKEVALSQLSAFDMRYPSNHVYDLAETYVLRRAFMNVRRFSPH